MMVMMMMMMMMMMMKMSDSDFTMCAVRCFSVITGAISVSAADHLNVVLHALMFVRYLLTKE